LPGHAFTEMVPIGHHLIGGSFAAAAPNSKERFGSNHGKEHRKRWNAIRGATSHRTHWVVVTFRRCGGRSGSAPRERASSSTAGQKHWMSAIGSRSALRAGP